MNYNYTEEAKINLESEQFDIEAIVGADEFDNVLEAAERIIHILKNQEKTISKNFYDYLERNLVTKHNISAENLTEFILDKQKQLKPFNGNQQLLTKQRIDKCINEKMIPSKRDFVFKLAFILGMSDEECEELLTKGMNERGFNFKNPLEVIYWYCLKFNKGFLYVQQLIQKYNDISVEIIENIDTNTVVVRKNFMERFQNNNLVNKDHENVLIDCLREIKQKYAINLVEDDVCNMRLYEEFIQTLTEVRETIDAINENIKNLNDSANKDRKAEGAGIDSSRYIKTDGTASLYDVAKFLYRDIPGYEKYNLKKYIADNKEDAFKDLSEELKTNRLTKERLHFFVTDDPKEKRYPQRKDLITILFLNYTSSDIYWNEEHSKSDRLIDFQEFVDETLDRCGMAPLNPNNIYEVFILLCMYANEPLEVFQEVYIQSILKNK